MKVALVQTELVWENPLVNRQHFEKKINGIPTDVDLIILPEMFTSGFTMQPKKVAENMNGETLTWLKKIAQHRNCAITGSLIISEEDQFYNRMVFVFPNGSVATYDKRHLFSLAGEEKYFAQGKNKVIVDYKNFKICLQICYDLRFPVFARNVEDYDILIYAANWPNTRILAWDTLLKARAIENMCYTVGVNRVGIDNNGLTYIGHTQINDCLGNTIIAPQQMEGVYTATLDKNSMLATRAKLNFLNDKDVFTIV